MLKGSIRSLLPYVVGLAIAVALYVYAGQFEYSPRPGQLGPDAWPRMVIALLGFSCLYEMGRRLLVTDKDATGVIDAFDRSDDGEPPAASYPLLLVGGIVLIAIYAFIVPILGFILATFLFLAAFMYLGRYRRHGVIWAVSLLVTACCGVLFLRIAYVSLPRGIAPFDRITDIFFAIPGF